MDNMQQEHYYPADDEIDLFDLVDDIKEKWKWLVGTGSVCVILAALYAFLAKPVYQTELVYKPVSEGELLPLNQPRLQEVFGIKKNSAQDGKKGYFSPEKTFKDVRSEALSSISMRAFYQQLLSEKNPKLISLIYNDQLSPEQNFSKFAGRFSHKDPGKKEPDTFLKLQFELADAELSSELLSRYGNLVLEINKQDTRSAVERKIQAQLEQWRIKIESKRTKYRAEKNKRLLDLQEAAAVAAKIKQKKPLYSGDRFSIGAQPPLYMMGERALREEIKQLQSRSEQDEDVFISGLPELLWKIKSVEEADINWKQIQFAQIDQDAIVPLSPVKPKKALILVLGAAAGGMLGVVFALLAAANKRRRRRKETEAGA